MSSQVTERTIPQRQLALSADGLLGQFNRAGVLEAADVHVARRLGELVGETSQSVLLAVALAVRAARSGAVCVDLATIAEQPVELVEDVGWPDPEPWLVAVVASPIVGDGIVRLAGTLLYLDRHWREEEQVAADLQSRLMLPPPAVDEPTLAEGVARLFGPGWDEQEAASIAATRQWTTVLTGGPGTGKTASVARMLVLIAEQFQAREGRPPRIAMAAPTGKASTRLAESVAREREQLRDVAGAAVLDGLTGDTMQRLLGSRFPTSSTRFTHHRSNRLPYDVIVVDEVSMLSLSMMARLLEAVRPTTRLILVGDPDQLASVEAGNVLADLVVGLQSLASGTGPQASVAGLVVQRLQTTHRYEAGAELDRLAAAIRSDQIDTAIALLTAGSPVTRMVDPEDESQMATISEQIVDAAYDVTLAAEDHELDGAQAREITDLLDRHRLLCGHRTGPFGVSHWNRRVQRLLAERTGVTHYDEWYPGRPVLITSNDRGLGLSNGDLGVTVRGDGGRLRVLVRLGEKVAEFAPTRLSSVETVYAMTVHKSQGSEAKAVTVILPPEDSPLLTRELFYTAVTRAQESVTVIGTEAALRGALERRVVRASGLAQRLAGTLHAERPDLHH